MGSDDAVTESPSGERDGKCSRFMRDMREIYEYRSIIRALVSKNLFGRYRNSVLGFGWHFVTPIVMMVVYYVVFTQVRVSPIDDFWIYIGSGIFPFTFMMSNLAGGAGAIVGNSGMVKKMYFPREIIVISQIVSGFITMLIGYAAVLAVVVLSGYHISWSAFLVMPLVLLLMVVFTMGYTFLFSSLTVYARDVQYVLGSVTMVFYFMTPMYFTADSVSGILGSVIWLNPFTYFVESCHSIVYYGVMPEPGIMMVSAMVSAITFIVGLAVFRRLKRGFAERL